MYTIEVTFKNSDEQNALFKGKLVNWFITKAAGDKQDSALLSGSDNTTDNGTVSIQISNVSSFEQSKDLKPVPVIFFHFKVGAAEKLGIQIKLLKPGIVKNIQFVKGSGITTQAPPQSQAQTSPSVLPQMPPPAAYNLSENNKTLWDWIIWETEGNSEPKYQRGGKSRKLGLYSLNYDKLRKAGKDKWQEKHKDHTIGGGWVKVAVLDKFDYSKHQELINTFLPCFRIEGKKVKEPDERSAKSEPATAAKSELQSPQPNSLDTLPPIIVMPFNYDDNGFGSNAIGKELDKDLFPKVDTERLELELTRWSTASRSTITAFPKPPAQFWTPAKDKKWSLRPGPDKGLDEHPFYPPSWKTQITGPPDSQTLCVFQKADTDKTIRYYSVKTGVQFVSTVNEGKHKKDRLEENSIHAMNRSNLIAAVMEYFGQSHFEARYQLEVLCILLMKDPDTTEKIDANPDGLKNKETEKPKYKRRAEIASELNNALQKRKSVWLPIEAEKKSRERKINELTDNEEIRKAGIELDEWLKQQWLKVQNETDRESQKKVWDSILEIADNQLLGELSKQKIPIEKIKQKHGAREGQDFGDSDEPLIVVSDKDGTVKIIHGGDHLTGAKKSSQTEVECITSKLEELKDYISFRAEITRLINGLEAENKEKIKARDSEIEKDTPKLGFDGIQVREIAEAAADEVWFPALAIPSHGKAFVDNWAAVQDWIKFWEDNYAIPMGRAKGEMLLHFGMQHMTSNAQNFLIAFDRQPGGATGKLKHLILRDIGDTLYNDNVFKILFEADPLSIFKKEFTHESGDKFGVTLNSSLGSYTTPHMLRIGATIVFFFKPFIQGDIAARLDCYRILANWCVAHNRAFMNYMRDTIGYFDNWNSGEDNVSTDFLNSLSSSSELDKRNYEEYKQIVVPGVVELNSTARWRLIKEFELRCKNVELLPAEEIPKKDSLIKDRIWGETKKIVNAHEVLICAEVQGFIQSERGKSALKKLHLERKATTAPVSTAPSAEVPKPVLTLDKFERLREGMNYKQVVEIIGGEGKDISEQEESEYNVKTYEWGDDNERVRVILTDDKLKAKYPRNLK